MPTRRTAYQMLTEAERRAADKRDLMIIKALVKRLEPEPRHPKANDLLRKNIDWAWDKVRSTTQWHGKSSKTGAWWSADARSAGSKEGLHGEHIVPFAVIRKRLFDLSHQGKLTLYEVRRLLEIPMAVITDSENTDLNTAGYYDSMPDEFDWGENSDWNEAVWSRHKAAGLRVNDYRQFGSEDGRGPT